MVWRSGEHGKAKGSNLEVCWRYGEKMEVGIEAQKYGGVGGGDRDDGIYYIDLLWKVRSKDGVTWKVFISITN